MIKDGAKVNGLKPEILLAYTIACEVYRKFEVDCVITEGTGGKHGVGSLHYVGLAIDLRTRDFVGEDARIAHRMLANRLGEEYDVVYEATHIHVEFQPK